MPVERREQAIAIGAGQPGNGRNPMFNGRRQPSSGGTSRMTRECHVRFCERLGVKFPGPTRRPRAGMELRNGSNFEVLTPYSWPESNILPAQMACGGGATRSRRPYVHMVKSFRWNLGDLIRVRPAHRTGP